MTAKPPLRDSANGAGPAPTLYPLNEVRAGVSVRIKQLTASPDVQSRLREMGFCEEQRIKLLLKHTNVICQVCNARLGISDKLARTIMVEQIHPPQQKAA